MSTQQPSKNKATSHQPQHGGALRKTSPPSSPSPPTETRSQQPKPFPVIDASFTRKQDTRSETMQKSITLNTSSKIAKEKLKNGGSGGGDVSSSRGTQSSMQKSEKNRSTYKPETTYSAQQPQSREKNGAKNEEKHGDKQEKADSKKSDDTRDRTQPENKTTSKEPKQNAGKKTEKHIENKRQTGKGGSLGDSEIQNNGKNPQQADSKTSNKNKADQQADSKTKSEGKDAKEADPTTNREGNNVKQTDCERSEGTDAEAQDTKASKTGTGAKQADSETNGKETDSEKASSEARRQGKDAKHSETNVNNAKGKAAKHNASKTTTKEGKDVKQTRSKPTGISDETSHTEVTSEGHTHSEDSEKSNADYSCGKKEEESGSGSKAHTQEKRKKSLDEDSLQMFLSSDGLPERAGDGTWMSPSQESDETKRRQEEIIRRILEEFDLDETMRKYRNFNAQSYRPKGTGLQDFQFRSELLRLMGTEEIRLNDHDWSKEFKEKLTADYERLLDEQEHNLAAAELQRMHRLRVEGILHDKPVSEPAGNSCRFSPHSTGIFSSPGTTGSIGEKRKKQESRYLKEQAASSQSWEFKPVFADEGSNQMERNLCALRQEKLYQPSEDVETSLELDPEKQEERLKLEQEHKRQRGLTSNSRHDSMHSGENDTSETIDELAEMKERIAKNRKSRFEKLPPNIRRLYEEETIRGLYQIAQELIKLPKPKNPSKSVNMAE